MKSGILLNPNSTREHIALNLVQAAQLVGVSTPVMLRLVHSEGFPAFKVGRRWVIPRAALEGMDNDPLLMGLLTACMEELERVAKGDAA